jgi:putative transcriptional regulator
MPIRLNLEPAIFKWQAKHAQKMTYAELAKRARISEPTIYRLSSGQPTKLDLEKLNRICKVLECDPGELLDRVETAPNEGGPEAALWRMQWRADDAKIVRDYAETEYDHEQEPEHSNTELD